MSPALLRGSKTDPQRPLPTDPLTTDSVRRRPTKLSHLIEDVTCEDGLRLLPRPTARSKALPDDQLVPEEGVLHTGLLMVARVLLPLSPSSLLHLSDRAVARGRSWSPSRHGGCPGRWNDDRRATRTRSLVDATRVVGRVRREAGDVAFDLVDQIEGRRRVVNMPAGQGVSEREYETGLRARGSLTVWLGLTDGKLANWNSPRPTRRKPGRQRKYSNHAIETTVTLGLVFGLASRQTEGFLRSRLTLLNLDNDVPDHSTISRRKARLGKVASYERRTVKPVHLLIDSSGLSVHVGQLRTPPKARDYRKLHLAVDEQTSDVVACELTSKRARDASRVASLVGQIERPIASAKADAAYDTGDVYKTLENHRAHRSPKVLIPPRKGAQLALDSAGTRQRNRNIRARSRVGKRKWYVASGYSRRSKVETTFHRYKASLGSAMRARGLASQRVEVRLGCKILNTMTALGIPDGEMIG